MIEQSSINKFLLLLCVINAVVYLFGGFVPGSLLYIGFKASCCILLAIYAFRALPAGRLQKSLVLALLFSSLGDIFLAIRSADYFVQGLGSFLIAHLVYVSIFAAARANTPLTPLRSILSGLAIFFAIGMMWLLWPVLGDLKAPVYIYITVISLMTVAAIHSSFSAFPVIAGAMSFMLSDATIAFNKFVEPLSFAGPLIWITYIAAQVMLTLAITRGAQQKTPAPG